MGTEKIKRCEKCGHLVAWSQNKNGKWFLARVAVTGAGYKLVQKPHFSICEWNQQHDNQTELIGWIPEVCV